MRQPPPPFDPNVKAALDEAQVKLAKDDIAGALVTYETAWVRALACADHAHASVIAHLAGVAEPDAKRKHGWNVAALREADAAGAHPIVTTFYPSLYNNLALSHLMLGDRDEALRYMELAASRLGDLEPGPYADRVRAAVEKQLTNLKRPE